MSPSEVVFRNDGDGDATWAMGSLFERLARPEDTQGALDIALVTQPPGVATPFHRHTREAEALFLLEGQMTYRAGDEVFAMVTGSFIYLPRGLPHAFRITGDRPARFLALATPGGLMDLYDQVGLPAFERRLPGEDGKPAADEIAAWGARGPLFGLEVLGPPIPA